MIKYATVTNISLFKVKFDSDGTESENTGYKRPAWYEPITQIGDRVAFIDDGKQKICIGKVV